MPSALHLNSFLPGDQVRILQLGESWVQPAREAFPGHVGTVCHVRPDPFKGREFNALVEFDPPVKCVDIFNRFNGATHFHFSLDEMELVKRG